MRTSTQQLNSCTDSDIAENRGCKQVPGSGFTSSAAVSRKRPNSSWCACRRTSTSGRPRRGSATAHAAGALLPCKPAAASGTPAATSRCSRNQLQHTLPLPQGRIAGSSSSSKYFKPGEQAVLRLRSDSTSALLLLSGSFSSQTSLKTATIFARVKHALAGEAL